MIDRLELEHGRFFVISYASQAGEKYKKHERFAWVNDIIGRSGRSFMNNKYPGDIDATNI